MKKIFILGGKFADIPSILSAKALGYYVITSGNNPNDLGHKYANEVALEDYSNKEAMLKLVESLKVDALFPACDDFSLLTCSYINEHLKIANFDDFETSKIIHHKNLWREFCNKHNIIAPRAISFEHKQEALEGIKNNFKNKNIIIKPIDSAAGKGVSILKANTNEARLESINLAFNASREGKIVVEEFIEGSNHGFSTILIDKKVAFYFYDNEQYAYNPFAVSGTTTSDMLDRSEIKMLIDEIERIAAILNLSNGIFHTQCILQTLDNGAKRLVIIEATRRAGGDLYPKFVSLALGIDYIGACISASNNLAFPTFTIKKKPYFARQCIMSRRVGIVESVEIHPSIRENIVDILLWYKKGEKIEDTRRYKAGIVFLEFSSKDEMEEKIANLDNLIKIITKEC